MHRVGLRPACFAGRLGGDELLFVVFDSWPRLDGRGGVDQSTDAGGCIGLRSGSVGVSLGDEPIATRLDVVTGDTPVGHDRWIIDTEGPLGWKVVPWATVISHLLAQNGRVQLFGM